MQRLLLRMIGQKEVGLRIREAREAADEMTQQELADAIGVATAQSISRYERGETEVPAKRLRKIAEATGRPMSFFVQEAAEVISEPDRLAAIEDELRLLREELSAVRETLPAVESVLALARDLQAALRGQVGTT
jgi:transcriptional regulator with XRE-family HTH domain